MTTDNNIHRYDDIINLPHHVSTRHPHMSLYDRAAQFSPFSALTGHEAAIKETARLTDEKLELDEDVKEKLNEKLQIIKDNLGKETSVTISYFVPDERKSGGAYFSCTGTVRRIDVYRHVIIMTDKTVIPMDQIYEMESELFE